MSMKMFHAFATAAVLAACGEPVDAEEQQLLEDAAIQAEFQLPIMVGMIEHSKPLYNAHGMEIEDNTELVENVEATVALFLRCVKEGKIKDLNDSLAEDFNIGGINTSPRRDIHTEQDVLALDSVPGGIFINFNANNQIDRILAVGLHEAAHTLQGAHRPGIKHGQDSNRDMTEAVLHKDFAYTVDNLSRGLRRAVYYTDPQNLTELRHEVDEIMQEGRFGYATAFNKIQQVYDFYGLSDRSAFYRIMSLHFYHDVTVAGNIFEPLDLSHDEFLVVLEQAYPELYDEMNNQFMESVHEIVESYPDVLKDPQNRLGDYSALHELRRRFQKEREPDIDAPAIMREVRIIHR